MMDEDASSLLPKGPVFLPVIHEGVARTAMFSFQRGTRRDHLDTGEIPGRPEAFLWLSPVFPAEDP